MFCLKHDGQNFEEAPCSDYDAWLVMTREELAQHSPFYLDIPAAVEISGALLLAMGVGFVWRMIRKSIEQHDTLHD